jgi:hypothetical protein
MPRRSQAAGGNPAGVVAKARTMNERDGRQAKGEGRQHTRRKTRRRGNRQSPLIGLPRRFPLLRNRDTELKEGDTENRENREGRHDDVGSLLVAADARTEKQKYESGQQHGDDRIRRRPQELEGAGPVMG